MITTLVFTVVIYVCASAPPTPPPTPPTPTPPPTPPPTPTCESCSDACISVTDPASVLNGTWNLSPGQESSGKCSDGGCMYRDTSDREQCFCILEKGGQLSHEVCPAQSSTPATTPSMVTQDVLLLAAGSFSSASGEVYGNSNCVVPGLPSKRNGFIMNYFDNQVLMCGGVDLDAGEDITVCLTLGRYNGQNDWVFHSNIPTNRKDASSVKFGGKLYILGGYEGNDYETSIVLDTGSSTWETGLDIPGNGILYSCAVELGGDLGFLVIGGQMDTTQVRQYDGRTSDWSVWDPLGVGRQEHSCARLDTVVVVAGGTDSETWEMLASTVLIDIGTGAYSEGGDMTTTRAWFVLSNVNGQLLAVGGTNTNYDRLASGEVLDPIEGGTLNGTMTTSRGYLNEGALVPISYLVMADICD